MCPGGLELGQRHQSEGADRGRVSELQQWNEVQTAEVPLG